MQLEARHKAAAREEGVGLLDIAKDEDVLPGDEHLVHDEDRVVLVEAARQRIVERAAEHGGALFVRDAADEFGALGVGRNDEDEGEIPVLDRQQPDMRDKGEMGQRRAGGDDLGAGDVDPGIGLAGHMRIDVSRAARRTRSHVAVDRRVDERMVDERYPLLAVSVPAPRIFLIGLIKFRIGAQRREKCGLVVGRPPEPPIGQARPGRDRVAAGDQLLGGARRHEIPMGEAAPFGRAGQHALAIGMVAMQRVVESGDHPRGIAKGRMGGHVLDPLAVDPHLPAVVEAIEEFLAGVGKRSRHGSGFPVRARIRRGR